LRGARAALDSAAFVVRNRYSWRRHQWLDAARADATPAPDASARNGHTPEDTTEHGRPDLWSRYRTTSDVDVRNELVERYRAAVESMAHRLAGRLPRSVDPQDLTHAGLWGLMQAIESFDPARGSPFFPFMRLRVRGAMLDELRHMDWLPRLWRARQRAILSARVLLRERLGREPFDSELASELAISEELLRRSCPPARGEMISRGARGDDDAATDPLEALMDETESPLESLHRRELLLQIEQSLRPIEWKVLRLHYLEGLTGRQVARRLRLSASRICQIHGRVLERLKLRLAKYGDESAARPD
jgi:RNA polymerase sigma factor for flagellar operon FliA